jgi:TRAP-type transport system periplasmic protein
MLQEVKSITMKRLWFIILAAILILGLILIGCSKQSNTTSQTTTSAKPTTQTTAAEKFSWTAYTMFQPTMAETKVFTDMIDKIQNQSNGRLSIKFFNYGELPYKNADELMIVRDRKVEMTAIFPTHVVGMAPWMALIGQPTMYGGFERSISLNKVEFPYMSKAFRQDYNIVALCRVIGAPVDLYSSKKVTSISDLKGLKMRTSSVGMQTIIQQLGGTPVTVDAPEMYTALKTGTLDVGITTITAAISNVLYEVCPWGFIWGLGPSPWYISVNGEAFDSLPKDLQDLVTNIGAEAGVNAQKQFSDLYYSKWDEAKTKFTTVNTISDSDMTQIKALGKTNIEAILADPASGQRGKELWDLFQAN